MTYKKIVFILLLLAPAGARAMDVPTGFKMVKVKSVSSIYDTDDFPPINRILLFHGKWARRDDKTTFPGDFSKEDERLFPAPDATLVGVISQTIRRGQSVNIMIPKTVSLIAAVADGRPDDYNTGGTQRNFVYCGAAAPSTLKADSEGIPVFLVKQSHRGRTDAYNIGLQNKPLEAFIPTKLDEWLAQHGKQVHVEGTTFQEWHKTGINGKTTLRILNKSQTVNPNLILFTRHAFRENTNGLPMPVGQHAQIVAAYLRTIEPGKSADFTVPNGAYAVVVVSWDYTTLQSKIISGSMYYLAGGELDGFPDDESGLFGSVRARVNNLVGKKEIILEVWPRKNRFSNYKPAS